MTKFTIFCGNFFCFLNLKYRHIGPTCAKMKSPWAMSKTKYIFFAEITTPDHKLSKTFYFIKISYVLAELWVFFYFVWFYFAKKCHFQSKELSDQDLSIDNTVWLPSADIKIGSQDAVKKVLELTEKWKYPNVKR